MCYRPILETGQRVPPDGLTINSQFTEALIFMVTTGRLAGQWVAACAAHHCSKPGLPIQAYARRDPGEPLPEPVTFQGDPNTEYPPTEPNTPASSQLTPLPAAFRMASTSTFSSGSTIATSDGPGMTWLPSHALA
ncbi:hypothetical protein BDN67DRAFT_985622 [Paxillus ammoniavirescens]|nr:hypothetical protein BDN67DRAFT_985622 [Paxillus ammoniavirescens]